MFRRSGWYPDPQDATVVRCWDGQRWLAESGSPIAGPHVSPRPPDRFSPLLMVEVRGRSNSLALWPQASRFFSRAMIIGATRNDKNDAKGPTTQAIVSVPPFCAGVCRVVGA
ncbi:DUF2510 domain-containing protein [Rhodococcus pyridinivorans]|uniref:DUF2510 domain-containing protein n=1 Tax=Rhodococcus pyridinivorans TaxID=103816 RepID=UPI00368AA5FC